MNGRSLGTMKFWDNQYRSERNYNERAAQGKSQELEGKAGAQWSAQASRRARVRPAAPEPHGRGRAPSLAHAHSPTQDRPHPRRGRRPRRRGLTCGRRAPSSAEQRGAGRPRAAPRPRLQPHSGAGRRTPPAAPRTGSPRAELYFRGGALATEDAAAGARLLPGSHFPGLSLSLPLIGQRAGLLGRADRSSPGGSQPSGPRNEVEKGRGARLSLTVGGRAMW